MGAGSITGIAIQGAIFSAINFGVGAATLNPIIFAAGAYYATSAVVRICEVAAKTRLQNNIISTDRPRLFAEEHTTSTTFTP